MREKRENLTSNSGQHFALVDRSDKGWWVQFTPPGAKRVRQLVGRGNRAEIAPRASTLVDEIVRLLSITETPSLARVGAELIHIKNREGKADGYTRKIEGHLRSYILPALGLDTKIGAVTADQLRRFRHTLSQGDLELNTCNRILTSLRQLFKMAEDAGYCAGPKLPRNYAESASKAWEKWTLLPPKGVKDMLVHLSDEVRPLFSYIANTGLRVGTALKTEVAWIDWEAMVVKYPAPSMKGRRPHTVELNADAAAAVRLALEGSPGKPFPYGYHYALKRWIEGRGLAGHPRLRIHDLRHSFVSNQLAAGTPIHVVRDMAAHQSLVVTQLYAHATDEARKSAASRVLIDGGLGSAPVLPKRMLIGTQSGTQPDREASQVAGFKVPRAGIEPATRGFSIPCSTD